MTSLNPFYSNPADSAMPYLEQIPGTITPYYQPYIDAGNDSLTTLMQQYARLISDPTAVMNQIGAGYTASPGYSYNYNQAMNAANQSAAAGGMTGTPANQQQSAQLASNLAAQDYDNYMKMGLSQYDTALGGYSDINHMGYQASSSLADDLAKNLMTEGSLAFQGTESDNASNASMVKLASEAVGGLIGGVPGAAVMAGLTGYGSSPTSTMTGAPGGASDQNMLTHFLTMLLGGG